jgi:predicted O-methyltransferase YrrM
VPILADSIASYLAGLRPESSPVMAEMEALAERERVPIVPWETGRLLAVLARAIDARRIVEVGTAIGYSTLHLAQGAPEATIVTLERDPERIAQARDFLGRAGVDARVEIMEGDALESLRSLEGPFDLAFVDATKKEYSKYLRALEPKLAPRALVAVDNVLMSGEVAEAESADTFWAPDALQTARALNADLVGSEDWLAVVLPVGDGVALAVRR